MECVKLCQQGFFCGWEREMESGGRGGEMMGEKNREGAVRLRAELYASKQYLPSDPVADMSDKEASRAMLAGLGFPPRLGGVRG